MAEMTIRLSVDPVTGKKNITISLRSDADALPHEHEQQHRQLVEKLIHQGLVKAGEIGQITIEREATAPIGEPASREAPQPGRQPEAQPGS